MNVLLEFMHYEFGSEVCHWSYKVEFGHGWGEGGLGGGEGGASVRNLIPRAFQAPKMELQKLDPGR